ncbi:Gfo/Idh/MocA family protein [Paenibacillus koleovorans]|uniref:Gfo/Idh/MocA family protein n=1 Tax=Paenibacillus koleovorans TaxID=121608 RepID=UPI000FD9BD8F|nr:Gfo/Idh/MocA family oxidoreductase [Paenibacillus koleovorans]
MTIHFAIVGCRHSHIGMFINEMLALGHRCVGLYDPDDTSLAEQLAAKHGLPLMKDRDAFLDPALQVQVIGSASINCDKMELVEWAERHGIHVMFDKPAVTDREQLSRLEAVIRRGRIQVGMLLTERFRPAVYTLQQAIAAGQLGRLVSVSMRKPHRLNPASRADWFFEKRRNGGVIVDLLIHDFDLLLWLTGQQAVSVQAVMTKNELPEYPDFWDAASAQVIMNEGLIAQLYADWHTPDKSWTWGDCRVFVNGTEGFAELRLTGDPLVSDREELLLAVNDRDPLHLAELAEPPCSLTEDFLRRIEGQPAVLTHEHILAASALTIDADEGAVLVNRFGVPEA